MINTDESQYMYIVSVKGNNICSFSSIKCMLDVIYFNNYKQTLCIKYLNINHRIQRRLP